VSLFVLAGVCFIFGAAWPAFKEISPPSLSVPVHQIATNPVSWFAVLILGMTASILLPKRRPSPAEHRERAVRPRASGDQPIKVEAPPSNTATSSKERIFVTVTPATLMGFYDGRTSMQANLLAKNYLGKWIFVQDRVANTNSSGAMVFLSTYNDGRSVMLIFDSSWEERISLLLTGDPFRAVGQIFEVDANGIRLKNCELIY
jgi:hypothetical protein